MAGAFEGIRIIDLTTVISGPSATMILADQGADVIKIEAPYGDFARDVATRRGGFSASFLNNNRNKRSVVLNLKTEHGLNALLKLIENADVFVQNFRPGVIERLGLGYESLAKINPKLIHVSIAGYGFEGPMANRPVYDPLIQAVSSLASVQAGSDEERPKLVRTIVPDKLTGIQASQAISAALFSRERTGKGQSIQLSMLDTIISFLWGSDMGGHTFIGDEMEREEAQSFIDLIYEVEDGYISVAVMQDKQWKAFCNALNKPQLIEDERFSTAQKREMNKNARLEEIQKAVLKFKQIEILDLLEAADVPCAPVLTRTQMRQHPQVMANKIIIETEHPNAGKLRQVRTPAVFSNTPGKIKFGAPKLGEHTKEVLMEAGFDDETIQKILTE